MIVGHAHRLCVHGAKGMRRWRCHTLMSPYDDFACVWLGEEGEEWRGTERCVCGWVFVGTCV